MVSKIDRTPWEGASFQADPSKLCGPMNERNVRVPSLIRVNTRLILEARVQDVEFSQLNPAVHEMPDFERVECRWT